MTQNDIVLKLMLFAILIALFGIALNIGMLFFLVMNGTVLCQ
jgi:hypothetical protein